MKKVLLIVISAYLLAGCSLFRRNTKYGCQTDGRNVGAEKLVSGDPKSVKAARKAKWRG
jgi:uncharacterized protein YcfL